MTLALNIAEPLLASDYGKAAFDAVGPVLLIGWAEVGPGMLQSVSQIGRTARAELRFPEHVVLDDGEVAVGWESRDLRLARQADARHWAVHKRPIAAEALRCPMSSRQRTPATTPGNQHVRELRRTSPRDQLPGSRP